MRHYQNSKKKKYQPKNEHAKIKKNNDLNTYSIRIPFKEYDNNRVTMYQACCLMLSVYIHSLILSSHL